MSNLALKYRPKIYKDFIGNKKIVEELQKRTIDNNFSKIALFLGETGTGKTTLERIYAKSLICQNLKDGEPCNDCSYCKVVDREQTTEYIHFYNGGEFGTDTVSQLIDKTEKKILGVTKAKKVFVIDELQSIKSKIAEEKLLKVLEKEYDNCYFIFGAMRWDGISKALKGRAKNATYKLKLNSDEILSRLIYIAKQEGIENTKENANLLITIADNCNGSLRDGIGLLESIIYRGIKTSEELFEEFDLLSKDNINKIIENLLLGKIEAIEFGITEDLYKQISQKMSIIYRKMNGLKLNWWQNNQIQGINSSPEFEYTVQNTIEKLNELYKYRYIADILIENYFISIVNSNKRLIEEYIGKNEKVEYQTRRKRRS